MLSSLQLSLIAQAKKKYKKILPLNGKSFQKKDFVVYPDKDGVEWVYFWFNHLNMSSDLVKQQINGKEVPCLNSKQL